MRECAHLWSLRSQMLKGLQIVPESGVAFGAKIGPADEVEVDVSAIKARHSGRLVGLVSGVVKKAQLQGVDERRAIVVASNKAHAQRGCLKRRCDGLQHQRHAVAAAVDADVLPHRALERHLQAGGQAGRHIAVRGLTTVQGRPLAVFSTCLVPERICTPTGLSVFPSFLPREACALVLVSID